MLFLYLSQDFHMRSCCKYLWILLRYSLRTTHKTDLHRNRSLHKHSLQDWQFYHQYWSNRGEVRTCDSFAHCTRYLTFHTGLLHHILPCTCSPLRIRTCSPTNQNLGRPRCSGYTHRRLFCRRSACSSPVLLHACIRPHHPLAILQSVFHNM